MLAAYSLRMNPMDLVWPVSAAAMATVFALTGIAIAADAVRSWHRTMGAAFALASGMLIATGFVTFALLVLHWAAPSTSLDRERGAGGRDSRAPASSCVVYGDGDHHLRQ